MTLKNVLGTLCLIAGLTSCSAVIDPDVDSLGSPPRACSPGTSVGCACPNGLSGSQLCNEGGSFEMCRCSALVLPLGVAGDGQ